MSETVMPEPVSPLTLQFLEWVSARPRTYADLMDAWQTTCPRHAVWEDAAIEGLVQFDGLTGTLTLTPAGRAALDGRVARSVGHPPAAGAP